MWNEKTVYSHSQLSQGQTGQYNTYKAQIQTQMYVTLHNMIKMVIQMK